MTNEDCDAVKNDGEPCTYPVKHEDGKCGVHTGCTDTDPGGRPSKFNNERAQLAIEAAREKKSEAGCARAAGVDENCIGRWKEANPTFEDGEGDTKEFREAFTRARAEGESKLIEHGLYMPEVDASMAKFLLASSFDYVKTDKKEVEHSGAIDGNRTLGEGEKAAIREALTARREGDS